MRGLISRGGRGDTIYKQSSLELKKLVGDGEIDSMWVFVIARVREEGDLVMDFEIPGDCRESSPKNGARDKAHKLAFPDVVL
jgi:hypothetical protein